MTAICVLCTVISACSTAQYQPHPISAESTALSFEQKNPSNQDFQDYLMAHGYNASQLPLKEWDVDDLCLAAFYFHSSMQIAKQQLVVAERDQTISTQNSNPSISGSFGRSDDKENPWIYGLSLSIPISTNNKQAIKLENAKHITEATRISIGDAMWQLRQNVYTHWLNYQYHIALAQLTQATLKHQQALSDMLEKRLTLGLANKTEYTQIQLNLLQTKQSLAQITQSAQADKLKLAEATGLSSDILNQINLVNGEYARPLTSVPAAIPPREVQAKTVMNRLDIRAALAKYAAQEAKLKLEYANQIPDITLGPSYSYEEGLNFWSLGISTLLKLAKNNQAALSKAHALRDLEAAQFELLQTRNIQQAEQARQDYLSAQNTLRQSIEVYKQQALIEEKAQKGFDLGNIDRYELTQQKLLTLAQQMHVLNNAHQANLSRVTLEGAMQAPLSNKHSALIDTINEVVR